MTNEQLIKKQEELDLQKYNQSFIARVDLAGKMPYCKGCMFRTDLPACVIDHETRQKYTVCARNLIKVEEEANATRKNSTGTGNRTNKKGSNV